MHTTTRRLQVGEKVAIRTGDTGRIVPLTDWPGRRPDSWSDETMVIVRWDEYLPPTAPMVRDGGLRYSPYKRAEAQEILTVVASAATTTSIDEYECPEPGCDFHILAKGPLDPDEPDYAAEEIEGHQRSHERDDTGRIHDILLAETLAHARNNSVLEQDDTEPQGEPADIAEDDGVHRASLQAGLTSLPAVVQLDRDDAAARVLNAAMAWDEASEAARASGYYVDVSIAVDKLRDAVRDYRQVVTR